jgi:CheY-like chemotaxis protein
LVPKLIDLNASLEAMHKMLRRLIGEDIELRTLPCNELARVRVDPGQIEQVIVNLAVNARDAMPKGGILSIETANVELDAVYASEHPGVKAGPHVMLAVSDSGTGMDRDTQARVFEPFFTTKEIGRGTGLGLASAYAIIAEHHGRITCESVPGVSTVFVVELPASERAALPAVQPAPMSFVPGGNETVLLIDDEPLVRRAAAAMLADGGYCVVEAEGGADGLALFERARGEIALVILDRSMPGMPGEQVAVRLRELDADVPIVLLSGYPGPAPSAAQAAAVLSKPVDAHTLLLTIRSAIDHQKRA